MNNWIKSHIDEEDRFGFAVTGGIHLVLLIIALLYQIHMNVDHRPAYIDVTLGEFRTGTVAEYAEVRPEEVATRPNPPETQPEDPVPDVQEPVEVPEQVVEEPARPVEHAQQEEEIVTEEVIQTPETERIDPTVTPEDEVQEEVFAPPLARADQQVREGESSGDERGDTGDMNVDQGEGADPDRAAPYDLQWEGDLHRNPMLQPLPENTADEEAVIRVRFEVHPDGSVGRIIPLIKMNPELEREVLRTLRSWRFSRLPSGIPQEAQWGTITFRFVFD